MGRGLRANAGSSLNPTERPAELAERDDLFLLFFVQDIAHVDGGYSSRPSNVLIAFSLAGFQVTTIGRIWVTAEAIPSALTINFKGFAKAVLTSTPILRQALLQRPPRS